MLLRRLAHLSFLVVLVLALGSCTGETDVTPSESTGGRTTSSTTTLGDNQPNATVADSEGGEDLLTFSRGTILVSQSGLLSDRSGVALQVVDGDPGAVILSSESSVPVELVFKLPAPTRFTEFEVPEVVEPPGRQTFFRDIAISGSAEGPTSGFQMLASGSLVLASESGRSEVLNVASGIPVRWIKVVLVGGLEVEPGAESRTDLVFTELIGRGEQEVPSLAQVFDGLWDLRLLERPDVPGDPLQLSQVGSVVTGCFGSAPVSGTVSGVVGTLTGTTPGTGDIVALVLVADDDGSIRASASTSGGRLDSRITVSNTENQRPSCSAPSAQSAVCGPPLYVGFPADSALIRRDSEQLLADIYRVLTETGVTEIKVIGHTSSEGSVTHNQELSEQRAQAVVDDLVRRGFPLSGVSAEGRGEMEPLVSPDDDETSRSINRRVEIVCGS